MNKSRKNILIGLFALALFMIGGYFILNKASNPYNKTIREDFYPYLEDQEKEILEKIISIKPVGLYTYEITNEKGDQYLDKRFYAPDYRALSIIDEHDLIYLEKDGYLYKANSAKKIYFKKKLDKGKNESHEYNIEYSSLVNGTSDGKVDGLKIYEADGNYIVESARDKKVFDKDATLIEEDFYSDGIKSKRVLLEQDPDFDKYFDEYYKLIQAYKEVDNIDQVD